MKTKKNKTIHGEIKKAIKKLKKAYWKEFELCAFVAEMESETISEMEAIREFDLKPSELIVLEEKGLEFTEDNGMKFYNKVRFQDSYDGEFGVYSEE